MTARITLVFLALAYAAAALLTYGAFRRFPDRSTQSVALWLLLYVATIVYPAIWTVQQRRILRRLGLDHHRELRQRAWAPMMVGGTALAIALALFFRVG